MGINDGRVCKIGVWSSHSCRRWLYLQDQKGGFGIGVLGAIGGTGEFAECSFWVGWDEIGIYWGSSGYGGVRRRRWGLFDRSGTGSGWRCIWTGLRFWRKGRGIFHGEMSIQKMKSKMRMWRISCWYQKGLIVWIVRMLYLMIKLAFPWNRMVLHFWAFRGSFYLEKYLWSSSKWEFRRTSHTGMFLVEE